jgi:hypothetical protein
MKYALTSFVSTAAVCAFICAAPTSAFAIGADAHAHAPQVYAPGYSYYAPGYYAYVPEGPTGAGPASAVQPQWGCGVLTDFNANGGHQRYTALCGPP